MEGRAPCGSPRQLFLGKQQKIMLDVEVRTYVCIYHNSDRVLKFEHGRFVCRSPLESLILEIWKSVINFSTDANTLTARGFFFQRWIVKIPLMLLIWFHLI